MTMTLPASPPATERAPSLDQVLRVVVALLGAIEGINGLTDLSILFGDISKIPGYSPGGLTILASIVLHPLLGFAALGFALARRLRYGIIALAVFALMEGASDMPSVIRDGIGWSGSAFVNATAIFKFILQPVIALAAIAAAWFNRYLTAATIGVMLPTLVDFAGVAAFAVAVSIHGF
jgi:hypothetical protein